MATRTQLKLLKKEILKHLLQLKMDSGMAGETFGGYSTVVVDSRKTFVAYPRVTHIYLRFDQDKPDLEKKRHAVENLALNICEAGPKEGIELEELVKRIHKIEGDAKCNTMIIRNYVNTLTYEKYLRKQSKPKPGGGNQQMYCYWYYVHFVTRNPYLFKQGGSTNIPTGKYGVYR